MSPYLLFFLLLAGSAAYYEYSWNQQSSDGFQEQIQNWETRISQLKETNKKLVLERMDLARQTDEARPVLAPPPKTPLQNPLTTTPAPTPTPPASTGPTTLDNLGTFTTSTGETYANAKLLKIEATDIVISADSGITQVSYVILPPELQKRFGWDPAKAAVVDAAEIRYQEQLEKAREDAAAANGTETSPETPSTLPAPANP